MNHRYSYIGYGSAALFLGLDFGLAFMYAATPLAYVHTRSLLNTAQLISIVATLVLALRWALKSR